MDIYESARKHGVRDEDIEHAVSNAIAVADADDDKVLHLGPGRVGNLLEIVSVLRTDGTELVIHAMRMRRSFESLLRELGDAND